MLENNKKSNLTLSEKERDEMQEIFQNSEEIKGQRLLFDDLSKNLKSEDEIKSLLLGNEIIDNPQNKHTLYYEGIEKMLRLITGKGKKSEPSFEILREEKNIFLSRGKHKDTKGIRHFDVRQAYEADMEAAYQIIVNAIVSGMNAYDLYIEFRNKNIESGYYAFLLGNSLSIANNERLLDIYREIKRRERQKEEESMLK